MSHLQEDDGKRLEEHHEEINKGTILDSEAARYVDPTLHISEEENKRLRKIIFTR
jgi:hypothetical protein